MPKTWIIKEQEEPSTELINAAESYFLAKLLLNRGFDTPHKIKNFLNPLAYEPVSPYAYNDMEIAVKRILQAIENKEHIVVYGDFDADGVTSTAVMCKTLKLLGADFSHYIPDRQTESHGLNSGVLLKKVSKEKAKLFITVDCGISDVDEVALVKNFGADVIITDHHEAKEIIPKALAIIDAKAPDSLRDDLDVEKISSLCAMAGVGVAFKLACALLEEYGKIDFAQELLPLVAVGTVADIMPLKYENRLFVTLGMQLIDEGKNIGLTELLRIAGVDSDTNLTSEKVAFTIAPRINAAGRLDKAETAFELLISDKPAKVAMLAQTLNDLNKIRQELGDKIYAEAVEYHKKNGSDEDSVIVAYNPEWHIGIVGIVASRLVETYNKPAFVFTDSPDGATFRASVRSIEGVNVFNVLEINSDLIDSYGGHSMAAGLALDKQKTSIEKFKSAINATIKEMTDGAELKPELPIDIEVELKDLTIELFNDLQRLEPTGEGNSYPLFAVKGLRFVSERVIGQNSNHLKFSCEDNSANVADCVFWGKTSLYLEAGKPLDIAFYPKINEFNGARTIQLDIQDYNSEYIKNQQNRELKIIDHRKKTGILPLVADYLKTSAKNFKLFVEDKNIYNSLSEYSILTENIVTRLTMQPAEQLMFFDYPADEKLLKYIIDSAKPKVVHFMNYKSPEADIDAFISKVSGMLKYASTHYNGVVYLPNISAALSVTDELVVLIIRLLNRTNVIKVTEFENGNVHFDFIAPVSIDVLKTHEVYESCRMELFKSKNYRDSLCSANDIGKTLNIK